MGGRGWREKAAVLVVMVGCVDRRKVVECVEPGAASAPAGGGGRAPEDLGAVRNIRLEAAEQRC